MEFGENGRILANFGPKLTEIHGNREIMRSNHPNSDNVQGIAPITEIDNNQSNQEIGK